MSGYMNVAAADSWIAAGPAVKARLEQIFAENGMPGGTEDRWTADLLRNSFDASPACVSQLSVVAETQQ